MSMVTVCDVEEIQAAVQVAIDGGDQVTALLLGLAAADHAAGECADDDQGCWATRYAHAVLHTA